MTLESYFNYGQVPMAYITEGAEGGRGREGEAMSLLAGGRPKKEAVGKCSGCRSAGDLLPEGAGTCTKPTYLRVVLTCRCRIEPWTSRRLPHACYVFK